MQECQRLHLVSAKRQDEIVQRLFQQMIAKKKEVTPTTSQQRAQIQAIVMRKLPSLLCGQDPCLSGSHGHS